MREFLDNKKGDAIRCISFFRLTNPYGLASQTIENAAQV